MAESGNKTEQPTQKRLAEAAEKGQFARSADLNTAAALVGAALVFSWSGGAMWDSLARSFADGLATAGRVTLVDADLPALAGRFLWQAKDVALPALVAGPLLALAAGLVQSRGQLATRVFETNLSKLDLAEGWRNVFNASAWVKAAVNLCKLAVILLVCWGALRGLLSDPVFQSPVALPQFLGFLASAVRLLLWRVVLGFAVVMAADYAYQLWRNREQLRMTREEVKEEQRATEGDPHAKAEIRRRRLQARKGFHRTVPTADVVVTNPTHIAVALKYEPGRDAAPVVVAKGIRLNALRIRELAVQFGVPVVENKPVARMLFKTGREGRPIDAALYQAVAEILAFVYRMKPRRAPAATPGGGDEGQA